MRKLLLIGILLFSFLPISSATTTNLGLSTMVASSSQVKGGDNITLVVYAGNSSNPVDQVSVTILSTDGIFNNNSGQATQFLFEGQTVIGITNSSGYVTFSWQAPSLSFEVLQLEVNFNATLDVDSVIIELSTSVTVKESLDGIAGSELIYPSFVKSNESVGITAMVKSNSNIAKSGVQVTFDIPEGEFISLSQGLTDTQGNFTTLWNAPVLTVEDPVKEIKFNTSIDISDVSLILNGIISMNISANITSITINYFGSELIEENSATDITLKTVDDNANPIANVELEISISEGTVDNNSSIFLVSDQFGEVTFTLHTPVLDTDFNTTIELGVSSTLGIINDFSIFEITVISFIDNFVVNWIVVDKVDQGDMVPVTLQVLRENTSNPVSDVAIVLETDLGVWSNNNTAIILSSNDTGYVDTVLNLDNLVLFFRLQEVFLVAKISKLKFNEQLLNHSLFVNRVIHPVSLTISFLENSDNTLDILAQVNLDDKGVENISLGMSATYGSFANNEQSVVQSTDENGKSIFIWNYDIPSEDLMIIFSLNVLSPNYSSDMYVFNITIAAPISSVNNSSTIDTNVFGDVSTGTYLAGGAVVVVLFSVIAVVVNKKLR